MYINPINYNTPNFQARIKVNKRGVENLIKGLEGITKAGSHTTVSVPSAATEATIFPLDSACNDRKLAKQITRHIKEVEKQSDIVSKKEIKSFEIEHNIDAKSASNASAGTATIASGASSYAEATTSALMQSQYDPNIIYHQSIGDVLNSNHSFNELMESQRQTFHNRGQGSCSNHAESYSIASTASLISGGLSNAAGSSMIKGGKEGASKAIDKILGESNKKIPS